MTFVLNDAGATSFEPEMGQVLLVIGQDKQSIEEYIDGVGVVPAGFMIYTSIQEARGLADPADYGAGVNHAQFFVDQYPHAVIQLAIYMVGALQGVVDGHYDDNIDNIAQWIKQARRPVYLRIGYEFDLPDNRYDPDEYQQAYRYIVDRFRALKVDNAAYVWHSAVHHAQKKDMMLWYPGDDYVDWIAVSYFNSSQQRAISDVARKAQILNKPLMIAESTSAGMYTTRGKILFLKSLFDMVKKENIKFISYINTNWDDHALFKSLSWGDARVELDPEIKAYWLNAIQSEFIIQYDERLLKKVGYDY